MDLKIRQSKKPEHGDQSKKDLVICDKVLVLCVCVCVCCLKWGEDGAVPPLRRFVYGQTN